MSSEPWNRTAVIEAICERVRLRLPLDARSVQLSDPQLYDAGRRLFGKWWPDAVEAARPRIFGNRLQEARKASQVSLKELGRFTDIHPSTIQRYSNGHIPDPERLERLAGALAVSVDFLLGLDMESAPRQYRSRKRIVLQRLMYMLAILLKTTPERLLEILEVYFGPLGDDEDNGAKQRRHVRAVSASQSESERSADF